MGSTFGATANSWTYRYNQRTPGAGAVYHAAENYLMFRGTSTGYVYFLVKRIEPEK